MSTTAEPPVIDPAAAAADEEDGGDALFPAADYTDPKLALDSVDGESIDKIAVAFSGRVLLDRSSAADVDLYRRLLLGKDVDLRVSGKVSGTGAGYTTNREGDLDAVVGTKTVKVESCFRPAAEEL